MSLFVPDKNVYCCGPQATKQRFAQKWERFTDNFPLSGRAEKIGKIFIQRIYDEVKLLPSFCSEQEFGLTLEWKTKDHEIELEIHPFIQVLDKLLIDNKESREILIEKIIQIML